MCGLLLAGCGSDALTSDAATSPSPTRSDAESAKGKPATPPEPGEVEIAGVKVGGEWEDGDLLGEPLTLPGKQILYAAQRPDVNAVSVGVRGPDDRVADGTYLLVGSVPGDVEVSVRQGDVRSAERQPDAGDDEGSQDHRGQARHAGDDDGTDEEGGEAAGEAAEHAADDPVRERHPGQAVAGAEQRDEGDVGAEVVHHVVGVETRCVVSVLLATAVQIVAERAARPEGERDQRGGGDRAERHEGGTGRAREPPTHLLVPHRREHQQQQQRRRSPGRPRCGTARGRRRPLRPRSPGSRSHCSCRSLLHEQADQADQPDRAGQQWPRREPASCVDRAFAHGLVGGHRSSLSYGDAPCDGRWTRCASRQPGRQVSTSRLGGTYLWDEESLRLSVEGLDVEGSMRGTSLHGARASRERRHRAGRPSGAA
jgi:hypothetical protein